MLKRSVPILVATILIIGLTILLQPLQYLQSFAQSNSPCRTFRETGKTVCEKFLNFWQDHGALPIFGYPLSNAFEEKSELDGKKYTVQYFERAVFELHPENRQPYDVLLSQLGRFRFRASYSGADPDEPDESNLPLYPNARNVKVRLTNTNVPDQTVINVTTFESVDSSASVLTFYKEVLEKTGWHFNEQRGLAYINYVHVNGASNPAYGLSIELIATKTGTNVTLRLDKTLPK